MRVLERLVFMFVAAAVTVVFSERIFWFWSPAAVDHLEAAAFYAVPAGVTLWAISRFRVGLGVDGWWPLLLVTPLYGYLVEGVITYVMYTGGPFVPFFPAYFAAWHGIGAFVILLVAFRRWLLAERWKPLLAASIAMGAFWGVWSMTLRLPENVGDAELIADGGPLTVLGPAEFARYAVIFTLILTAAHWLLGRVWQREFRPTRPETAIVGIVVLAMLTVWTTTVVWAIPMFVAYVALQIWALRRYADRAPADRRSLLVELDGRIRVRALWPILSMAPVASLVYVFLWQLGPSELAIRIVMYGIVAAQAVIGLALSGGAIVRAARRRSVAGGGDLAPSRADQALSRS